MASWIPPRAPRSRRRPAGIRASDSASITPRPAGRLQSAYAAELEEPVPDRLLAALRKPARAAAARSSAAAAHRRYSLAAGVLIAAGLGFFSWRHHHPASIESVNGALIARGALAAGLSDNSRARAHPAPARPAPACGSGSASWRSPGSTAAPSFFPPMPGSRAATRGNGRYGR